MKALVYSTRGACAAVHDPAWRSTLRLLALLTCVGLMPCAGAAPAAADSMAPPVFDTGACYQLVNDTGRKIAWARWQLGAPEDNVVVRFDDDTPEWIVDLTRRWIEDAYHWRATDDQERQARGAGEFTTPETMAMWLRRIARQCSELHT